MYGTMEAYKVIKDWRTKWYQIW